MYRHDCALCCASASANSSASSHSVSTRRRRPAAGRGHGSGAPLADTSTRPSSSTTTSFDALRNETAALHDDLGRVGEILARLSELAVPGTATEFEVEYPKLALAADRKRRWSLV
jgi:hypothetical protein